MDEKTQSDTEWVMRLLWDYTVTPQSSFFTVLKDREVLQFYFDRTGQALIGERLTAMDNFLRQFYEENMQEVHYEIESALSVIGSMTRRQLLQNMIRFLKRYYNVSTLEELSTKTGIANLSTRLPALLTMVMPISDLILEYAHYIMSISTADIHIDADFVRYSSARVLLIIKEMLDHTTAEQLLSGLNLILTKIRNNQIALLRATARGFQIDKLSLERRNKDLKLIQDDIMIRLAPFKDYVNKAIQLIEKRRNQQIDDEFRAQSGRPPTSEEQKKLVDRKQLGRVDPSIGPMIQEFMGVSGQRPAFIGLSPDQRRSRQTAYLRDRRKSVDEYERPTFIRTDSV